VLFKLGTAPSFGQPLSH